MLQRFAERRRISTDVLKHTANGADFLNLIMKQSGEELCAACEVSPRDVAEIAAWYLDEGPTATFIGAGLQRYDWGGENVLSSMPGSCLPELGRAGGEGYYHRPTLRNLNLDWIQLSRTGQGIPPFWPY